MSVVLWWCVDQQTRTNYCVVVVKERLEMLKREREESCGVRCQKSGLEDEECEKERREQRAAEPQGGV
jgi:hypothetical protein